jgi:hypothetical protein
VAAVPLNEVISTKFAEAARKAAQPAQAHRRGEALTDIEGFVGFGESPSG